MAKTIGVYIGAPAQVNLQYARRESVVMTITVYSNAAKTTVYNLTDCDVFGEVRKADGTDLLVSLSPTIPTPANGQILIDTIVTEVPVAQFAKWDILLVLPTGERIYIVKGQFKINPSITDDGVVSVAPTPIYIEGPQGPEGPQGDQGEQGIQGLPGQSVTIQGSVATSTALLDIVDPDLGDGYITTNTGHLWVYVGPDPGEIGGWEDVGNITGPAGEGVPEGGATGQLLTKASNTDYDTEWVNPEALTDPTAGLTLQERIDYAYTHGRCEIPFGENVITEKLLCANKGGLVIDGAGGGINSKPDHQLMGARSAIHWGSAADTDAMLHLRGAGIHVSNLGFYGDEANPLTSNPVLFNEHGGFPDSAILISSDEFQDLGAGSGQHQIEGCTFFQVRSAIQAGVTVNEIDGNTVLIEAFRCMSCDNLFRSNQVQALGFTFLHGQYSNFASALADRKVFRILGGGDFEANRVAITSPATILSIEQILDPAQIGSNSPIWRMNNLKIDTNATSDLQHVNYAADNSVNDMFSKVEINGICHSGSAVNYEADDKRVAVIRGRANITYSGGWIRPNLSGAFEWHNLGSGYPVLRILGTTFGAVTDCLSLLSPSTSEGDLKFEAYCYVANGDQMPAFEGIVSGTA